MEQQDGESTAFWFKQEMFLFVEKCGNVSVKKIILRHLHCSKISLLYNISKRDISLNNLAFIIS
jgi:hypothetical protein